MNTAMEVSKSRGDLGKGLNIYHIM